MWKNVGSKDDPTFVFDRWTNFQIVTRSIVVGDDGHQFALTVIPADGSPSFDVTVPTSALGDVREFKGKILSEGLTATFDGGQKELNRIKEFVGSHHDVQVRGTRYKGLHGSEFVLPGGTISPNGWD